MIPHWVLVVVLFAGGEPVNSKFFGPMKDAAECEKNRQELVTTVHDAGLDLWAECREVKLEPKKEKPKGEPGTDQKS